MLQPSLLRRSQEPSRVRQPTGSWNMCVYVCVCVCVCVELHYRECVREGG